MYKCIRCKYPTHLHTYIFEVYASSLYIQHSFSALDSSRTSDFLYSEQWLVCLVFLVQSSNDDWLGVDHMTVEDHVT